MRPPPHVIVIALLAVAPGILGVLRALEWVRLFPIVEAVGWPGS
jgi:hypothetical protein